MLRFWSALFTQKIDLYSKYDKHKFMQTEVKDKAINILLKKFEEGKQKNIRWSQRAFAQRLGLSSGALSEILQGKRLLSSQLKRKISSHLQLSPLEEVDFFEDELPNHLKQQRLEYYKISDDQFRMISDWWHYAILNLVNTRNFTPSIPWIAQRLGLDELRVKEAWSRLFELGHLKKVGKKVIRTFARLETSDHLFNLSIQKSHLQDLELIEKSLRHVPVDLRDHTSMTVTLNKKNLKKAKELIRIFQDQFSKEIETLPGDEVYKLSVAFYPLTQNATNKK